MPEHEEEEKQEESILDKPGIQESLPETAYKPQTSRGLTSSTVPSLGNPASYQETALGAVGPYVGPSLGSSIGGTIAAGGTASQGLKLGIDTIGNKLSSGLTSGFSGFVGFGGAAGASATNAALAARGGSFGPATSASVSKAAAGSSLGSAAGVGIGAAATTLLMGGSVKDAAISGVGSAVGFAIGNAILPGVGGYIGSFLGGMVGGFFGGGQKRTTLGIQGSVNQEGVMAAYNPTNRGASNAQAMAFGNQISDTLNVFKEATGFDWGTNPSFNTETNIGSKDPGTWVGTTKVSSSKGDSGAVSLNFLRSPTFFKESSDEELNKFWSGAISSSSSISGLASAVDSFFASRTIPAPRRDTSSLSGSSFSGARYANF